eukprot:767058-Hanusia_phi.AAC.8
MVNGEDEGEELVVELEDVTQRLLGVQPQQLHLALPCHAPQPFHHAARAAAGGDGQAGEDLVLGVEDAAVEAAVHDCGKDSRVRAAACLSLVLDGDEGADLAPLDLQPLHDCRLQPVVEGPGGALEVLVDCLPAEPAPRMLGALVQDGMKDAERQEEPSRLQVRLAPPCLKVLVLECLCELQRSIVHAVVDVVVNAELEAVLSCAGGDGGQIVDENKREDVIDSLHAALRDRSEGNDQPAPAVHALDQLSRHLLPAGDVRAAPGPQEDPVRARKDLEPLRQVDELLGGGEAQDGDAAAGLAQKYRVPVALARREVLRSQHLSDHMLQQRVPSVGAQSVDEQQVIADSDLLPFFVELLVHRQQRRHLRHHRLRTLLVEEDAPVRPERVCLSHYDPRQPPQRRPELRSFDNLRPRAGRHPLDVLGLLGEVQVSAVLAEAPQPPGPGAGGRSGASRGPGVWLLVSGFDVGRRLHARRVIRRRRERLAREERCHRKKLRLLHDPGCDKRPEGEVSGEEPLGVLVQTQDDPVVELGAIVDDGLDVPVRSLGEVGTLKAILHGDSKEVDRDGYAPLGERAQRRGQVVHSNPNPCELCEPLALRVQNFDAVLVNGEVGLEIDLSLAKGGDGAEVRGIGQKNAV